MRTRSIIATIALLLLAGCGSGSDAASDSGSESSAVDSGSPGGELATATFDPSLLPSTPIDPGLLIAVEGSDDTTVSLSGLDSIVDECSTLDSSSVTEIVAAADTLGLSYDFVTSESGRASCRYTSDTHAVEIFVNRADALDEDIINSLNGFGGNVTSRPGGAGGAATLYFEDSFDIVTFFAARAERDGWATVVVNAGGTGMLESDEEYDGWGDLAIAALDGAAELGEPAASANVTPVGARPCDVYTPDELSAVFGVELQESLWDDDDTPVCTWKSGDEAVVVSLLVGPADEGPSFFGLADASGDGIFPTEFGNGSVVANGPQLYQLTVIVRREAYGLAGYEFGGVDERDTQPLVDELVANLSERTS